MVWSGTLTVMYPDVDAAARRSSTYWLLSRLVLEPPTAVLLQELQCAFSKMPADRDAPVEMEVHALRNAVGVACNDSSAAEALCVEHTRLLGGVSKDYGLPPPYESVVLEDKLPGEATIAVSAAYAEAGFGVSVPQAGPADHLATELRFLALLCHGEYEAAAGHDHASAEQYAKWQQSFLDNHVLRWVPKHCEQAKAAARTSYHRALFALIANACRLDAGQVEPLSQRSAA